MKHREVKHCDECGRAHTQSHWALFRCWVDQHPRYWFWWTTLLIVNTILNLADVFGFGGH